MSFTLTSFQFNKTGHVRNNEARSCNHYCSGKTVRTTYSECAFAAIGIQHVVSAILASVAWLVLQYFFLHNLINHTTARRIGIYRMRCTAYKVAPDDGLIQSETCTASNGKWSLITRILCTLLVYIYIVGYNVKLNTALFTRIRLPQTLILRCLFC